MQTGSCDREGRALQRAGGSPCRRVRPATRSYRLKWTAFALPLAWFLAACDPYHGFGCIAPESHPAVAHARSLTDEQLAFAYDELHRLHEEHVDEPFGVAFSGDDIPQSLAFLKADLVRFGEGAATRPYVALAHCWDERVELRVSARGVVPATISLSWATPTRENAWATASEVLWQKAP